MSYVKLKKLILNVQDEIKLLASEVAQTRRQLSNMLISNFNPSSLSDEERTSIIYSSTLPRHLRETYLSLLSCDQGQATARDIAVKLEMTRASCSHNLNTLVQMGWICKKSKGRETTSHGQKWGVKLFYIPEKGPLIISKEESLKEYKNRMK